MLLITCGIYTSNVHRQIDKVREVRLRKEESVTDLHRRDKTLMQKDDM